MLNITPCSARCVRYDGYADYIPFLSSATNLGGLVLHYLVRPEMDQTKIKSNHYFTYLEHKTESPIRCLILIFLPIVGNICFIFADIYARNAAETSRIKADNYSREYPDFAFRYFVEAANYGSAEAMYKCGALYWTGYGVSQDQSRAMKYFRHAAALGCPGAQEQLGKLSPPEVVPNPVDPPPVYNAEAVD